MDTADKTATQVMMERRELEISLGAPPPDIETDEDFCRWVLVQIDIRAKAAAEPYIKRLVEIESRKAPRPIFVGYDPETMAGFINSTRSTKEGE